MNQISLWKLSFNSLLVVFGLNSAARAADNSLAVFEKYRNQIAAGQETKGLKLLKASVFSEQEKVSESLKFWLIGELELKQHNFDSSLGAFTQSQSLSALFASYNLTSLAKLAFQKEDLVQAKSLFLQSQKTKPPVELQITNNLHLGDIASQQKKWREAEKDLLKVLRLARGRDEYPRAIYKLIAVEQGLGRKWKACRWARKLHSDFPSHPLFINWGLDLDQVEYEGKKLACLASVADQRLRLRRLQLAGMDEKWKIERDEFARRVGTVSSFQFDFLQAQFLINEGLIEEALALLNKHYETQSTSYSYLMTLGMALARAGQYDRAVGVFYQAYELKPPAKLARAALFQSALLSYQYQDYDGALRKFGEFLAKYSNSGLVQDVKWHVAWIRYLRGDYEQSLKSFEELLALPSGKRRRRPLNNSQSLRARYWATMSLMRLGRTDEAIRQFTSLSEYSLENFYSISAGYRLGQLQKDKAPQKPGLDFKANPLVKELEGGVRKAAATTLSAGPEVGAGSDEGDESEENIEEQAKSKVGGQSEVDENEKAATQELAGDETDPKNEKLKPTEIDSYFTRAKLFELVGRPELAIGELVQVELKARDQDILKTLLGTYLATKNYWRAGQLVYNHFSQERLQKGLDGGRAFWEASYPLAYENWVMSEALDSGVPRELIWSIMRAESQYRETVMSPVGAKGLMQLMPQTAIQMARLTNIKNFRVEQLLQPQMNIQVGTRYLARLSKMLSQNLPAVAASYNAGPHRVSAWVNNFGKLEMDEFIEHIPFSETRTYVKRVITNFQVYKTLYSKEPNVLAFLAEPVQMAPVSVKFKESFEEL